MALTILPSRGAYAVLLNHELAAVIGYDLKEREAHLIKIKDIELKEATEFVNDVRRGVAPRIPHEQTIIIESWELYGLTSGPIEIVTEEVWKKLEEDLALKHRPGELS